MQGMVILCCCYYCIVYCLTVQWHHVTQGFFQLFIQGGRNEIVWIIGGQVCICVQSMWQSRGVRGHAPPGNLILDLLLDVIWWNLGLFLRERKLPFIVSLKILQRVELIYMRNRILSISKGRQAKAKGGANARPPWKKPCHVKSFRAFELALPTLTSPFPF